MQKKKPTKQDIVDALQRLKDAQNRVSQSRFQDDTGWGPYWFDKFWPETGYRGACEEAGVQSGLQVSVDANLRMSEEEVVRRLADAITRNKMAFPTLPRLRAISRLGHCTICRDQKYDVAKKRLIYAYLSLADEERVVAVERVMRGELNRLDGGGAVVEQASVQEVVRGRELSIRVPAEFISTVREFRDRGEEEQRQLVARLFVEVLGYRRSRVRSEHEHNEVRVNDRRDKPWLVAEVKPSLGTERDRKSARRQGFDYTPIELDCGSSSFRMATTTKCTTAAPAKGLHTMKCGKGTSASQHYGRGILICLASSLLNAE